MCRICLSDMGDRLVNNKRINFSSLRNLDFLITESLLVGDKFLLCIRTFTVFRLTSMFQHGYNFKHIRENCEV